MNKEDILNLVPSLSNEEAEMLLLLFEEKLQELPNEDEIREEGYKEAEKNYLKKELKRRISGELEKAGVKSVKAISALLDFEKISLVEDELCGLCEQLDTLKKEYAFMFESKEDKPRFTGDSTNAEKEPKKEKLSYKEMLKLFKESPDLYKQIVR